MTMNDNNFGWYNSSQAESHKISDIICISFLILDFVEVSEAEIPAAR